MSETLQQPAWLTSVTWATGRWDVSTGTDADGMHWRCYTPEGMRFWYNPTTQAVRCSCGGETFRLHSDERDWLLHATCSTCGHWELVASD